MSRREKEEAAQIRRLIAEYVQMNGVTNTRDIADEVGATLGFTPSTATVSKVLQDLGYLPQRQPSFIWRHNPPR